MKKYTLIVTLALMAGLMSCGDAKQKEHQTNSADTISNQPSATKTARIPQKITPSLWVDKDAKAVVDYYLSIFKNGKMKQSN